MKVAYIQKTSLIDWPGEISTTIFTRGCNFNCTYCFNSQLISRVYDANDMTGDDVIKQLLKRKKNIDHVVITGGEATDQSGICDFISELKSNGFKVKLDTNGSHPYILYTLLKHQLIDYAAIDIKSSEYDYVQIINIKDMAANVRKCIDLLNDYGLDFEFRTTVWKEHHTLEEMKAIFDWVGHKTKRYYIQNYTRPDEAMPDYTPWTKSDVEAVKELATSYPFKLEFRGDYR